MESLLACGGKGEGNGRAGADRPIFSNVERGHVGSNLHPYCTMLLQIFDGE